MESQTRQSEMTDGPDRPESPPRGGTAPEAEAPGSFESMPFRRYSLLATAGIVPLVVMVLALLVFQFDSQRRALLGELEDQAIEHNILLGNVIKTVQDHVQRLAAWTETYAQTDAPVGLFVRVGEPRQVVDGGIVLHGPDFAGRSGAAADNYLAHRLIPHMRLSHDAMPYLRWSYFRSGRGDLMTVFPFADGQDFGGELREASVEEILQQLGNAPPFGRETAEASDLIQPYWTEAYFDPTGAGWMVAYAVPVQADGRVVGVVGTTMLLDFLNSFMRAFDHPAGRLWLVNQEGQVLAASDGRNLAGLSLLGTSEVLPPRLQEVAPEQLLAPSRAFRRFGDQYVLAQKVGSTPWTLLFVAASGELNSVVLPRLVPYGIILAGLVLTLLLAHLLRQRLIVRPALSFANYIRAEAADRRPPPPRLPTWWQPLAGAAADAFEAQRSALQRIQDSEALKSAIINSALDALIAIDEDGVIVEFNPSAEQIFGIARPQALGQQLPDLIIPQGLREQHIAGMHRYLRTGQARMLGRRTEMEAQRAGGEVFPVELAITEVRQAGRRLFTAYLRDITGRLAMERALRESERHFRTIAEAHPVPVNIARLRDRVILYASQAFADLFGLSLDEVIGKDNRRFYVNVEDRARLIEALNRDGFVQGFEVQARRADGTVFPVALASRMIEFQGEAAIVSGVLDLTEQKRAEAEIARQREALRRSEQRFRTIAEAHPVPVLIVRRADRRVLYASQPFLELMRVTPEDVAQMASSPLFADDEDRERISAALRARHEVHNEEVTVRRPDGTLFAAAITARPVEYEGEDAAVFGVVDLTEQKKAEAEIARQREALHQSEKLNALGSLLANVAHELNNPLSVVVGYATMMRDVAPDEATRQRAIKVHAAAERCARIVKTFLTMARRKPEAFAPVRINHIIESALDVAGYGLRSADVSVTLDLAPNLPAVAGDADQLTLVLMNLIVNAQHALQTQPQPRRLEIVAHSRDGAVEIEVADNGPGIPADIAERIFDPFFTTKPQGVGTGIGLSVCQGIVTAHGGEIGVASRPEGGALFIITLPITQAAQQAPSADVAPTPIAGRVLVVEDEVEIAQMVSEVLHRDHHEVCIATSGRQALDHLADHPVDLILSDVRMPDLDGPGLHRELSSVAPELAQRMVFVTGDVLTPDTATFLARTSLPVIEKPIDPYDLRLKVRTYLAALQHPKTPPAPPK
jgi:PAS domain S-box-containing protein